MKVRVREHYTVHLAGQDPHKAGTVLELTEKQYAERKHQVLRLDVVKQSEPEKSPEAAVVERPAVEEKAKEGKKSK